MLGAFLAVFCAFTWSVSVILFKKSGESLHPVLLNLLKNSIALVLIVPTIFVMDGVTLPELAPAQWGTLLFSGLIGIGIADAMVLKSLREIGASRIAIVECTYSPFVMLLSILFLGEALTDARIVGALFVAGAILCVSLKPEASEIPPQKILRGMLWGVAGLFSMAAGIVMIKPLFAHVPLFWLIGIRLLAGVVASVGIFMGLRNKATLLGDLRRVERKAMVATACVLSTYVSMILWVAGYKFNDATVAAVLNQTSTIFTVVLAALVLKERFTPLKVVGTALALAGVVIITFG